MKRLYKISLIAISSLMIASLAIGGYEKETKDKSKVVFPGKKVPGPRTQKQEQK